MKLYIVMYHYVRDLSASRYPRIKGLDLSLFHRQLVFLKEKFHTISCEQLLEAAANGVHIPGNSALLTFDDGYIDHYTNVFPLLVRHKLTALFSLPGKILNEGKVLDVNKIHFVLASASPVLLKERLFQLLDHYRGSEYIIKDNRDLYEELAIANRFDDADTVFIKRLLQVKLDEQIRSILIDRLFSEFVDLPEYSFAKELYLSMDQVKLMKKCGMYFGIHGYDHFWLDSLPANKMQQDIRMALDLFSGIIDHNRWIMCYPYGAYNEEVLSFVRSNHCLAGVTTKVAIASDQDDWLALPRLDTNDFPPKSQRYLNILNAR